MGEGKSRTKNNSRRCYRWWVGGGCLGKEGAGAGLQWESGLSQEPVESEVSSAQLGCPSAVQTRGQLDIETGALGVQRGRHTLGVNGLTRESVGERRDWGLSPRDSTAGSQAEEPLSEERKAAGAKSEDQEPGRCGS